MRDLFKALGGAKAVADMMCVSQTAVYMAIQRGTIPHRWRIRLLKELTERGIPYDPALLGMEAA
jgi:hypothetical protein